MPGLFEFAGSTRCGYSVDLGLCLFTYLNPRTPRRNFLLALRHPYPVRQVAFSRGFDYLALALESSIQQRLKLVENSHDC